MNGLQVFQSEQFGTVRTIDEDGKILFCGSDVAKALGYKRPEDAIIRHCKQQPHPVKRSIGVRTGTKADGTPAIQQVEMLFIAEGDLYRLITHSRLPAAETFEKWVFDVVLPTIRQTGRYDVRGNVLPTARRRSLPMRTDESKARQNWLNFMLSALEGKLGLSKENMLHQAYESMSFEGLDLDEIKARYIENTGLLDCSTFEAICNDRVGAAELADILHSNMKIVFIKRSL